MTNRADTIIFDFFGVICSEIAPFWLRDHFSADEADSIKATRVAAADRGVISQRRLFEELAELTGQTAEQIEAAWIALARIDWPVVDCARALGTTYKIGLLTNSPSPLVRRLIAVNKLADLFDATIVSSEQGCAKPDPRIYELTLKALQASPASSILIDDNPANIEGALRVGISGVLFESSEQLRRVLPTSTI